MRRWRRWAVVVVAALTVAACDRDGGGSSQGSADPPAVPPSQPAPPQVPAEEFPLRGGSDEAGPGDDVVISRVPGSYRITSRIEGRTERDLVTVRTEVVEVRRPWESRLVRRAGADASGSNAAQTTTEVGRFGRRSLNSGAAPLVLALPPSLAPADVRADDAVQDAVDGGLVERRERRMVAGRLCQVLRSRSTLAAATLQAATPDEYGDSCVDDAGLVLEELLVTAGRPSLRTVAVRVEEDVAFADDAFTVTGPEVPVRDGGGSIRRLAPEGGSPDGMLVLPTDPPGFRRRGRYSVVPPQGENFTDVTKAGLRTAGVADVWEQGADAIVLEQGATLRGGPAFASPSPGARTVGLGRLGTGEVTVSFRASEIRVAMPGGRYVRIYGTVPVAELEGMLRNLQPSPPAELVFSDEPL